MTDDSGISSVERKKCLPAKKKIVLKHCSQKHSGGKFKFVILLNFKRFYSNNAFFFLNGKTLLTKTILVRYMLFYIMSCATDDYLNCDYQATIKNLDSILW